MIRWCRSADGAGERWHPTIDGQSICGVAVDPSTATGAPVDSDDRCRNCDRKWRERGRVNRPKAKRDLAVYRPRFRFEDAES